MDVTVKNLNCPIAKLLVPSLREAIGPGYMEVTVGKNSNFFLLTKEKKESIFDFVPKITWPEFVSWFFACLRRYRLKRLYFLYHIRRNS